MSEELYESLLGSCEHEDDLGVVIRTHIVIEQYLNRLIDILVPSPSHIKKMSLDYDSTVKLSMALGLDNRFESALNNLGSLRNGFAHNLKPEITKNDVNNMYKCLSAGEKEILNSGVKKAIEKLDIQAQTHKSMSYRQQYINIVVILGSALHTACKQAPNNGRAKAARPLT